MKLDPATGDIILYRHDPERPGSLSGDLVLAVQEDCRSDLWVGTRLHGLNRFDRETETFSRVPLEPAAEGIWDVLADRRGSIWIGTQDEGLFRIEPETGEIVNYRLLLDNPRSLGSNTVWTLFEDGPGTVWAGTNGGGLNAYRPESDDFDRFYGDSDHPRDLARVTITALAEDEAGRLWIGTSWDGLRIWDRASGEYTVCRHDPGDPQSLGEDHVTAIRRDASGIMWVATARGGIGKCLADRVKFLHYKPNPHHPRSISRGDVRALLADGSERLWVGLDNGIDTIDLRTGAVTRLGNRPLGAGGPGPGTVNALCRDGAGRVWLGAEIGLYRVMPGDGPLVRHAHDPTSPNSLSSNRVFVVIGDRGDPDVLWIGTAAGLDRFDAARHRWRRYSHDPQDPSSLSGNIIRAVIEDRAGALWVGGSQGLNRMDKATGRCERFIAGLGVPPGRSIDSNAVNSIHEDRGGRLWAGTDGGLNRFDPETGTWTFWSAETGLPGAVVCGILEDGSGRLWISTNRGLASFDPNSGTFTAFGLRDGLQDLMFNPRACARAGDGALYFGDVNGFNRFYPAAVRANPFAPPVVLTGVKGNGRALTFQAPLLHAGGLRIPYKIGFLTLEFAALCYVDPARNRFAARLEPRDPGWIDLGPEHTVSFSNLDAGRYVLHVKAANPDGVWNDAALELPIEIVPPFWKTMWFAGILALFLASGALAAGRTWRKLRAAAASAGENLDRVVEKHRLTARETEILRLVLTGGGNKDIARKLFISASTVRNHIYNIHRKMGVKNRLELVHRIGKDEP